MQEILQGLCGRQIDGGMLGGKTSWPSSLVDADSWSQLVMSSIRDSHYKCSVPISKQNCSSQKKMCQGKQKGKFRPECGHPRNWGLSQPHQWQRTAVVLCWPQLIHAVWLPGRVRKMQGPLLKRLLPAWSFCSGSCQAWPDWENWTQFNLYPLSLAKVCVCRKLKCRGQGSKHTRALSGQIPQVFVPSQAWSVLWSLGCWSQCCPKKAYFAVLGGGSGKSDSGLTVEPGRGLTARPPPGGSRTRSGSGRASLPRLSERRVMAVVMAAGARTAPLELSSERWEGEGWRRGLGFDACPFRISSRATVVASLNRSSSSGPG